MPQGYFARIIPLDASGKPVDPGYGVEGPDSGLGGGIPVPPIQLPPLPPDLPHPVPPIHMPGFGGGVPSLPIYLPVAPDKPIALPPGTIWPPLPPDVGIAGKVLILIWIVGVGFRWFYTDGPSVYPPVPTPK